MWRPDRRRSWRSSRVPTPGTPDDGGATAPAGPVDGDVAGEAVEPAEPGMVDVAVAPAPTAAWLELLAGLLVSGTRTWPLTRRATSTTAAAAAAPTGAAIQRLAAQSVESSIQALLVVANRVDDDPEVLAAAGSGLAQLSESLRRITEFEMRDMSERAYLAFAEWLP